MTSVLVKPGLVPFPEGVERSVFGAGVAAGLTLGVDAAQTGALRLGLPAPEHKAGPFCHREGFRHHAVDGRDPGFAQKLGPGLKLAVAVT